MYEQESLQKDSVVKSEPGTGPASRKKGAAAKALDKAYYARLPVPSGIAGKMRIHKSGKITILWGNEAPEADEAPEPTSASPAASAMPKKHAPPIEMEVNRGIDCQFLQDVVIMKPDVAIREGLEGKEGTVFALGQIKSSFVVSPNFQKLLPLWKRDRDRDRD